jgi:hypothetical protein
MRSVTSTCSVSRAKKKKKKNAHEKKAMQTNSPFRPFASSLIQSCTVQKRVCSLHIYD